MTDKLTEFLKDIVHGPCASVPLSEHEKHIRARAIEILKERRNEAFNLGKNKIYQFASKYGLTKNELDYALYLYGQGATPEDAVDEAILT